MEKNTLFEIILMSIIPGMWLDWLAEYCCFSISLPVGKAHTSFPQWWIKWAQCLSGSCAMRKIRQEVEKIEHGRTTMWTIKKRNIFAWDKEENSGNLSFNGGLRCSGEGTYHLQTMEDIIKCLRVGNVQVIHKVSILS